MSLKCRAGTNCAEGKVYKNGKIGVCGSKKGADSISNLSQTISLLKKEQLLKELKDITRSEESKREDETRQQVKLAFKVKTIPDSLLDELINNPDDSDYCRDSLTDLIPCMTNQQMDKYIDSKLGNRSTFVPGISTLATHCTDSDLLEKLLNYADINSEFDLPCFIENQNLSVSSENQLVETLTRYKDGEDQRAFVGEGYIPTTALNTLLSRGKATNIDELLNDRDTATWARNAILNNPNYLNEAIEYISTDAESDERLSLIYNSDTLSEPIQKALIENAFLGTELKELARLSNLTSENARLIIKRSDNFDGINDGCYDIKVALAVSTSDRETLLNLIGEDTKGRYSESYASCVARNEKAPRDILVALKNGDDEVARLYATETLSKLGIRGVLDYVLQESN